MVKQDTEGEIENTGWVTGQDPRRGRRCHNLKHEGRWKVKVKGTTGWKIKTYLKRKSIRWFMDVSPGLDLHMVFTRRPDVVGAFGRHSTSPEEMLEPLCQGRRLAGSCILGLGSKGNSLGSG